MRYHI